VARRRCGTAEGRANQQRSWRACVAQLGSVLGRRRRRKRTCNMRLMSVTLEVSKLSGWLKACASCQRRHPTEGNVWHAGDVRTADERANQQRARRACGPARECGQTAQAEAHVEHAAHACDAGGVKAQRLVESFRILPSNKGAPDMCRVKRVARRCGTAEGRVNQQRACLAQLGSVGRRRRRKRTSNMPLMDVTLEVSKLSGRLKASAYCRVQRGHLMEGNVWHGDVAQQWEGRISSMGVWPSSGVWAEGAGGSAH
jgi:hypothetical protein